MLLPLHLNQLLASDIAAPSGLVAVTVSPFAIDLTWIDASFGEFGFRVERRRGVAGTFILVGTVEPGDIGFEEEFRSGGLIPDTEYFYRVQAFGPSGVSPYSLIASATTDPAPPGFGEKRTIHVLIGNYGTVWPPT